MSNTLRFCLKRKKILFYNDFYLFIFFGRRLSKSYAQFPFISKMSYSLSVIFFYSQ